MFDQLAKDVPLPEWATEGTRYRRLAINDLWVDGCFYKHMKHGFYDTEAGGGRFRKMFERAPSIRLNIPMTTADLASRKLFAGRHIPRVIHPKQEVQDALQWLMREARLDRELMTAAFKGQSGAVAICLKIVQGKPRVDVYCAKQCYPVFNDAKDLERMVLCYGVDGSWWLSQGIYTDTDGDEIKTDTDYWYIRIFDDTGIFTTIPVKYEKWAPENHPTKAEDIQVFKDEPWTQIHNLKFVPVIWCTNLVGGEEPDGRSTFHGVLDNCVDLDYDLSQVGRGGKAMVQPKIVIKGRLINYDKHTHGVILDSSHMIHLEPDKKMGEQEVKGSDAKLLEMEGGGISAFMKDYIERISVWTKEIMSANRKDPNTVKGTLSGKAIELIDEDFIDLIYVFRQAYGDYGLLLVIKWLAIMCCRVAKALANEEGLKKFKGVKEEDIEDLELRWPELYEPDAQDTQFLSTALTTAIAGGLIAQPQAALIFDLHLDKSTDIFDLGQEYGKIPAPNVPNLQITPPGADLPKKDDVAPGKKPAKKKE